MSFAWEEPDLFAADLHQPGGDGRCENCDSKDWSVCGVCEHCERPCCDQCAHCVDRAKGQHELHCKECERDFYAEAPEEPVPAMAIAQESGRVFCTRLEIILWQLRYSDADWEKSGPHKLTAQESRQAGLRQGWIGFCHRKKPSCAELIREGFGRQNPPLPSSLVMEDICPF